MRVRDAIESDATALAALSGRPVDTIVGMVHDRSVSVAVDTEADDEPIVGFVAFDARTDAVYLTGLAGQPAAVETLLTEPKRFAKKEAMDVEAVVKDTNGKRIDALERAGFTATESGPRFDGEQTTRYVFERDQ